MVLTRQLLRESWRSWWSTQTRHNGPRWLQYVWTFVFSLQVALAFTVAGFFLFGSGEGAWRNWSGWGYWYARNLVVSLCIGFAIHGLFDAATRWIGAERIRAFTWQRLPFYIGLPMLGTLIGWPLGMWLTGADTSGWRFDTNQIVGSVLIALLLCLAFYQFFAAKSRQIDAERRATEAQLRLLQGQIEPHFLFNTLANVLGLMERDTPRARVMLEAFTDYLRSSLGSLRADRQHTLGDELDLVEAYLQVIKIRMDDRLRVEIDVPAELRALPLPALCLQPLVENAIQHGLEPKIDGGAVQVRARLAGGRLALTVQDDGLGLPQPGTLAAPAALAARAARHAGTGTALANIRARLSQAHGGDAQLSVEAAAPHGVRAMLTLPVPLAVEAAP